MRRNERQLLTDLLKAVSRSFYLTLRVLPPAVRPQIGLAYLLARATDTVADTELIPVERRLEALGELEGRILGSRTQTLDFSSIAARQPETAGAGTNAERVLLQRIEEAISLLRACGDEDQRLIQEVLVTIVSGQSLDLRRFGGAASGAALASLQTEAELDDYTFRVAGCVGGFWTRICRVHVFPEAKIDEAALMADAVRFGKGLQLVNILRDLPKDLQHGRCYVPAESLARVGMAPIDLRDSASESRFRPLYNQLLDRAWSHLEAGWGYTNALPRSCIRVRLACAWPILIGAQTIRRLRSAPVLDSSQRVKISRADVRRILTASILSYPSERRWKELFQ